VVQVDKPKSTVETTKKKLLSKDGVQNTKNSDEEKNHSKPKPQYT
jgi:hypothetical protein